MFNSLPVLITCPAMPLPCSIRISDVACLLSISYAFNYKDSIKFEEYFTSSPSNTFDTNSPVYSSIRNSEQRSAPVMNFASAITPRNS